MRWGTFEQLDAVTGERVNLVDYGFVDGERLGQDWEVKEVGLHLVVGWVFMDGSWELLLGLCWLGSFDFCLFDKITKLQNIKNQKLL
jgi:hypothetical protein